ncbi:helix-turn-helix domain-containing protein [Bacillus smithii]|uniref:helix-turn-helix domain-containing protein n=1 Tax=Bacillus smithii TaxID=1479 RepID=UPI00077C0D3E|nr:helix-turn-helix transcriptional regulator [Bacillus smithii]
MFPQRLKSLRLSKKLSQQDMANLLGITRQAYGRYESGLSEPDIENLRKLANFFDVSIDYLLDGQEYKKVVVAGEEILLSEKEYRTFQEMKKYSILFHDLATAPEAKVKQLIKMWEIIKEDYEEEQETNNDN